MWRMKPRKRVVMEPELEALAGHLGACDRLLMAEKLGRWRRQLRVTARMLLGPPTNAKPRRLPRLKAAVIREN